MVTEFAPEGFRQGTLITMSDGRQKAIENILPHEKVLSYNLQSKRLEARSVARVISHVYGRTPNEQNFLLA